MVIDYNLVWYNYFELVHRLLLLIIPAKFCGDDFSYI